MRVVGEDDQNHGQEFHPEMNVDGDPAHGTRLELRSERCSNRTIVETFFLDPALVQKPSRMPQPLA